MSNINEDERDFMSVGGEVLLFTIDDAVYGIEIKYVNEIIGIEQITVVPRVPYYIKGVINIRGKVVPIISTRARFGKEEIPYDERTCIIVLEFDGGNQVGIIVDRVKEVMIASPRRSALLPRITMSTPATISRTLSRMLTASSCCLTASGW